MATSILNPKTILLAVCLALGVRSAAGGNYPFFPDTTLGKTYYWKSYLVDGRGKLTYHGVYTNTISGTQLVGGHTYVIVSRRNPNNQRLENIIFRCDDELCGTLDGSTEDSLVVAWRGEPRIG